MAFSDAVFWCEQAAVVRWDRATSKITKLATASCSALAADANALFWTAPMQRLERVGRSGGGSTTLFTGKAPSGGATTEGWYSLALDDQFVYWTDFREAGGVYYGPKTGGATIRIAEEEFPTGVAVDDDAVYWATQAGIKRWSKTSHDTVLLTHDRALGGLGAENLQVDEQFVYWISNRGLERTPKNGGTTTRMFEPKEGRGVSAISLQAGCIYFGAAADLYRMPLAGGAASLVWTPANQLGVAWFAADAHGVYWSEWEGYVPGNVYMLPHTP